MDGMEDLRVPHATITQTRLYALLETIRQQDTVYKLAGTVHGCALFTGDTLQIYVEDVGRHNAIDVIAGWLWMNEVRLDADAVFYTTGRLTSEMVLKSAQMGIGVLVSRNGITQMGHDLAQQLGVCAIGRAKNKHYLVYTAHERVLTHARID
jgi:FdhD protein